MLVPPMTNEEITREIRNDYKIITESSTLQRLAFEYYTERKRAKVKKDADYPKFRDFKTRSKKQMADTDIKEKST
jgi:hypothetical protein